MRWLAAAMLLGLCACGEANSLDGSISESFPLEFDSVRIRLVEDDLLIEYLRKQAHLSSSRANSSFAFHHESIFKINTYEI